MTDLENLLRTDAANWRAAQRADRDLDEAVRVAARPTAGIHRRGLVLAAAAAVVAISGVTAVVVDRTSGIDRPASTGAPSAPTGTPSAPISSSSPEPSDVPMLHPSDDSLRTLLSSSGRYDRTFRIDPVAKGGELSAVCLGGGTIKVNMPGAGGFDLDCTGTPSGAALPTLGTKVTITGVRDQLWRVAVYGG